jgi:hypothetical protein
MGEHQIEDEDNEWAVFFHQQEFFLLGFGLIWKRKHEETDEHSGCQSVSFFFILNFCSFQY